MTGDTSQTSTDTAAKSTSVDSDLISSSDDKAARITGSPPVDKTEESKAGENSKPQMAGTAETEVPTAIEVGTAANIIYQVKYKNASGEVTEVRKPREPFKLRPTISDLPVLEVHITVTPIDMDQGKTSKETTGTKKEEKADEPDTKNTEDPDTHPENFKVSETTLRIRSRKLLNALKAVVKYYPGQTLLGDTVSFSEPFQLLVHHRAELEEYKSRNTEMHSEEYKKTCNEHIDVLLNFLKNHFGKSLQDEEERHRQTPPVCTFEYVWLLLKPGEPCFVNMDRSHYYSCNIKKLTGGIMQGRPTTYEVSIWNVQCDGYELGRVSSRCAVLPFDGEKEIKSILIFPTRFHKDSPKDLERQNGLTLEQKFIARGKKYWELTKSYSYKGYEGTTVTKPYQQVCAFNFQFYSSVDSKQWSVLIQKDR